MSLLGWVKDFLSFSFSKKKLHLGSLTHVTVAYPAA